MSVHRLAKYQADDPFTRVPNSAINDERLDLKARGLLLLMLSKPDGWTFRERQLAEIARVGRDQLRAAMQILIDTGYVVRTRESFDGKPPVCVTRVYDMPCTGVGFTGVGFTGVGFLDRRETRPLNNEGVLSNEEVLVTNEIYLAEKPQKSIPAGKPDLLFEALAETCGINTTQLTASSRGQLNRATKELRDIGATPEQVTGKAAAYRKTYDDAVLTPTALAKHWPSLATKRDTSATQCRQCFQPLADHDEQVHNLITGS